MVNVQFSRSDKDDANGGQVGPLRTFHRRLSSCRCCWFTPCDSKPTWGLNFPLCAARVRVGWGALETKRKPLSRNSVTECNSPIWVLIWGRRFPSEPRRTWASACSETCSLWRRQGQKREKQNRELGQIENKKKSPSFQFGFDLFS